MAHQSSKKFLMIVAAGNYVTDGVRMLEGGGVAYARFIHELGPRHKFIHLFIQA
jgi:hypothetical protein